MFRIHAPSNVPLELSIHKFLCLFGVFWLYVRTYCFNPITPENTSGTCIIRFFRDISGRNLEASAMYVTVGAVQLVIL